MADKPHIIHTSTSAGHGSASSHASRVNGQWLSVQAQEVISNIRVHRAFDDARDPLLAKQLNDADNGRTESQRRGETDNGGPKRRLSDQVTTQHGLKRRSDRPSQLSTPAPKSQGWLKAQAQIAMASVAQQISKPVCGDRTQRQSANANLKRHLHHRKRDGPQP